MMGEVYKLKVDTPDELVACILYAANCMKKVKFNWDEQHVIFPHELQSVLRLNVGFFEHFLWTETNFSFFVTIHN